jgi:hypothetical protein
VGGGPNDDVYRLRLHAGETFRGTADGASAGSIAVMVYQMKPRPRGVTMWFPSERPSFAFMAETDATYYFFVFSASFWDTSPTLYRFSYEVAPKGTDIMAPSVRLPHFSSGWRSRPVSADVVADDGPGGSGVARIELSHDDGLTWTAGTQVSVDAPADHSNDGFHFVRYRAVDVAGNVSPYRVAEARIDTQGPSTRAWGPDHKVRRGAHALVRYRIDDISWWVRNCRLVVRSAKTGRLVSIKRLGTRYSAGTIWWNSEYRYRTVVTCDWPAGAYTVKVAGSTADLAGNRWETATCEQLLIVK